MKSLASYLITILVVMFWIFRVVLTLTTSLGIDIGIELINIEFEIILLFITLVSIVLIIKRNILGAAIYFASYFFYFGIELYDSIMKIVDGKAAQSTYLSVMFSGVAVILALMVIIDVALTKYKSSSTGSNKKSDWFYGNKQYDRTLDERADKNNYKF